MWDEGTKAANFLSFNPQLFLVSKKLSDLGGERELFVIDRGKGFEDQKTRVQNLALPLGSTVAKDRDQEWKM